MENSLMSTDSDIKRWMTTDDVAEYLGVKRSSIYQYVSEKRIPVHRIPDSQLLRFSREEIDHWMEMGRVETIAELREKIGGERKGNG
jgi:excisionase family DNA binding protein